jgi:1-acyl-sn-glycerol-3-phosphate acyltransferase
MVGIFPEGKITKDGKINQLKAVGIERIVSTTPVPVVPVRIDGLWGTFFSKKPEVKNLKTLLQFKRKITVTVGKPIAPQDFSAQRLEKQIREL